MSFRLGWRLLRDKHSQRAWILKYICFLSQKYNISIFRLPVAVKCCLIINKLPLSSSVHVSPSSWNRYRGDSVDFGSAASADLYCQEEVWPAGEDTELFAQHALNAVHAELQVR